MEGRDTEPFPSSARPLLRARKKDVVDREEKECIAVALVHSLTDIALAQLRKAALVLVL